MFGVARVFPELVILQRWHAFLPGGKSVAHCRVSLCKMDHSRGGGKRRGSVMARATYRVATAERLARR
jgi:hypothetical protein